MREQAAYSPLSKRVQKTNRKENVVKARMKMMAEDERGSMLFDRMPLWSRPGYLIRRLHQIHHALFFEECNDFPSGANDDLVDATTLALARFRQGGFIKLPSDEEEDMPGFRSSKNKRLYAV